MDKNEKYFLELLSSHINNEIPTPIEDIDWKAIYHLGDIHNVIALLSTQINKLPFEYKPKGIAKSYFNQALGLTISEYDSKIESYNLFIDLLNENKIKHLVIKGAVLRNLYPAKELRTSGDTDAVIEKEKFELCGDMLLANSFTSMQRTGVEDDLFHNGHLFELKKDFETINDKSKELFYNPFDKKLSYNDGYTYYLFPIYHLVYVVYHILLHIKHGGAGVRQLLDICVLINNTDIDTNEFLSIMKELDLEKSTFVILSLCKEWFNLDINIDYEIDSELKEKLSNSILTGGTFGYENGNVGTVRLAKEMNNKRFASLKAIFGLFITSSDYLYRYYPYARKHHILLPMAYFNRLFDAIFKRGKQNLKHIESMLKDKDNAIRLNEIINELQL